MSSARSTDRAPSRIPPWAIAAAMVPPGWILILQINHWRIDAPVVFLFISWAAVIGIGLFLGHAAMAYGDAGGLAQAADEDAVRSTPRSELMSEKRSLLKAVKEMEFERDMGKISDADANHIIGFYRARAIAVMKRLDALGEDDGEASVRERIEREVKARVAVDRRAAKAKAKAKTKTKTAAPAKEESEPSS
ncbi:MAG TPA: hypothetical protein VFG83_13490 [Kofleriaceae bacterium]|nr:hypothetical protein [Kofleriaceae bacterium]